MPYFPYDMLPVLDLLFFIFCLKQQMFIDECGLLIHVSPSYLGTL